jgi:hypothetical protein
MPTVGKKYDTLLTRQLASLQKDLSENKITEEQFGVLVGLLLKMEVNAFVRHQIKQLELEEDKKMTFIHYAGHTKFTHA